MEDVLSVVRQYNVQKKEIVTEGDRVVFGESSWPKDAQTNYVVCGTGEEEGQPERYYTLHSVLFLLANEHLAHPSYVLLATAQSVPVVREPDREAMLSYLNGEGSTLGGSAFPEIDLTIERKRAADEAASSPLSSPSSSPDEAASPPRAKRSRVEDEERPAQRECPAVRLEAHRQGGADRIGSLPGATTTPPVENECSDADDVDDLDHRFGATPPAEESAAFHHHNVVTLKNSRCSVDAGSVVTTALQGNTVSREMVWGSRNTVLQSTKNHDFSKNILAILQSVRAKEKKEQNDAARADLSSVGNNQPVPAAETGKTQTPVFNNVDTAEGFYEEDTTLTSVTEGAPTSPQPLPRPTIPQSRVHNPPPKSKQHHRASRTAIIVVPAGSTSLITMANAKDLLQDATFVTAEEKRRRGVPRDREVLLQHRRKDSDSTATVTVPYRVTDQPFKLSAAEWERVAAVFVAGPAWQFKGWPPRLLPPGGSPADVFARIPAFHLKYDEAPTDANVTRWTDVMVLEVSRRQRHLDRPAAMRFWEALDRHMVQHKPHLRY